MTIDYMVPSSLDDIYGPGAEEAAGYEGMEIEECLMMAQENLRWIIEYSGETQEKKLAHAAIAQAAALTAQAMMAAEQHKVEMMRHQVWIDNTFGEIPGDPFLDTVISEEIAADFAEDTSL